MLTDVILSFRTYTIGMSADKSNMFCEVELHEDDRNLHRFLQAAPGEGGGGGGGEGGRHSGHAHDKSDILSDFFTISGYTSAASSG